MITDVRINAKGELEGKVNPPAKWEEMYTKDEVVDMLVEIQLEIEELEKPRCHNASHADGCVSKWKVEGVIQEKINALRGNEDDGRGCT